MCTASNKKSQLTYSISVYHTLRRLGKGGMGLFFFKNATEGGDWIIQERLENDAFVTSLLPDNAPLSTMRVISASR